jgi:hypothetical protein
MIFETGRSLQRGLLWNLLTEENLPRFEAQG